MTDLSINISKTIRAPISKVFNSWLDPETLAKFMLPMPGMETPEVQNDARVGGAFTIIMRVGANKIPHTGKYLQIDHPKKPVFSWISPESVDDSVVTLNFTETGKNHTNVELTQVKFIDEKRRANHEGGWGNILSSLDEVLS